MNDSVVSGEVIDKHPDLEQVNQLLLDRLYILIGTADSEAIVGLTECVAKYNASIRNNQVFKPDESDEEKARKHASSVVEDILKGE